MATIDIDAALCCGDELCVKICPAACFRMKNGKAHTVPLAGKICLECGQCVAICPKAAISLNGVAAASLEDATLQAGPEALARLMKSRRSVRAYKDKPVPHEVLITALETASYAPTGKNRQDLEWLAIDDKAKLWELSGKIVDVLRPQKEAERLVMAYESGIDPIFRTAPCVVFAHCDTSVYHLAATDGGIATGYLELVLHSMGLASCWAGYALGVLQHDEDLRDYLGLSRSRNMVGALMLGYPKYRYARIPERKKLRLSWR